MHYRFWGLLDSCLAAVERDNSGKNAGRLLRGIKLTGFFTGTCGKLADQVFISIAQYIAVTGKYGNTLSDFGDNDAKLARRKDSCVVRREVV